MQSRPTLSSIKKKFLSYKTRKVKLQEQLAEIQRSVAYHEGKKEELHQGIFLKSGLDPELTIEENLTILDEKIEAIIEEISEKIKGIRERIEKCRN